MDTEYAYTRRRMHFGKRCNFSDCDKIEVGIKSEPVLMSDYVRVDPATHATQCSKVYAVHEVRPHLLNPIYTYNYYLINVIHVSF